MTWSRSRRILAMGRAGMLAAGLGTMAARGTMAQTFSQMLVFDKIDQQINCSGFSITPGVLSHCQTGLLTGSGFASALANFGRVSSSASFTAADNAYSNGLSYFTDHISFGAGPIPANVVFWLGTSWSLSGTGNVYPQSYAFNDLLLRSLGTSQSLDQYQYYNFPAAGLNPLTANNSGQFSNPSTLLSHFAFQTLGSNTFDFELDSQSIAQLFGNGPANMFASNSASITGIQFLDANGNDITNQVTATFGSGYNDFLGAPTITPEPTTVSLMALGFVGLGAAAWRKRKKQARTSS